MGEIIKKNNKKNPVENQILVIFGSNGDLAKRKLLPAIFQLYLDNLLPENFIVIGAGSQEKNDEINRQDIAKSMLDFTKAPSEVNEDKLQNFLEHVYYQKVNNQSPEDLRKVLECGITNYILKSSHEQELIEAVNATIGNRKYFSSQILDVLLALKKASRKIYLNKGHAHITYTEQEIIKLITQGLTTREIATLKNLSYHTVITHRKNIFRKLAIGSSSELILYAMHAGIVDTTDYYI